MQLFAKHHVPLKMPIELPTIESMKRFVQMDAGVAIAPRMCVRWEIEEGLLVEVKVRQLRMPRDLYVIYRRSGPLSHAATAMLRLLRPRIPSPKSGAPELPGAQLSAGHTSAKPDDEI